KNISKKIDKKVWDGRFLGTPTRRRDEKPGGGRTRKSIGSGWSRPPGEPPGSRGDKKISRE
ncbi:MAG: hypothetical protein UCH90_00485, partial [Acutalibacteraceae bacterium]|nr:hypothetical protein [Acutalibacteraceae bacterium]